MALFIFTKITSFTETFVAVMCCWRLKARWKYAISDSREISKQQWANVVHALVHHIGWHQKLLIALAAIAMAMAKTMTNRMASVRTFGRWALRLSNWAMVLHHFQTCIPLEPCFRFCEIHHRLCIGQPIGRKIIMTSLQSMNDKTCECSGHWIDIINATIYAYLALSFRCLEKNPENRPFMVELIEHPFFTELIGPTGKDHHVMHILTI